MTREKLTAPLRLLLLAALTLALSSALAPAPIRAQSTPAARPPDGYDQLTGAGSTETFDDLLKPISAMIELADEPAAVSTGRARARGLDAARAGREQRGRAVRAQGELLGRMRGANIRAQVLYQVQSAYNGIAVMADGAALKQIQALPGVKAVRRLALLERDNTVTVPLIGAPKVWEQLSNSANLTGRGLRIGVIDTGVDYVHTNFGGTGTAVDLALARSAASNPPASAGVVPPGFAVSNGSVQLYPSAKVVGGYDFAGDAYNADSTSATYSPVPAPDPNPLDCPSALGGGHGSHVAGTVAGYGVKADGSTYSGPWSSSTPFGSLRIGPGVAPEAQLYALRVFGCAGSTALTTLAIDWAVDPNRDGDPSDHLDVINMSLGSGYGTPDDASATASENAAAAGVIVVASAGNSGDIYYISGSPGSSTRTLTVASSVDSTDIGDGFEVLSPSGIAGVYGSSNSVAYIYPAGGSTSGPLFYPSTNRDGCASFAAGSLSGKIVLLDWIPAGQSASACGSAVRVNNARAGNAIGVVMAYHLSFLDTAITGAASIPATLTTSTVGQLLKGALGAGAVQVKLSNQYLGTKLVDAKRTDTLSTFSSRGPRNRDNALKPDISAPGQTVFSTDAGSGTLGRTLSGTSMAAPHMTGVMALLKQKNPTWTVEELKALAMNTAGSDLYSGADATAPTALKYGPARVGAGRVQVDAAIADSVVAYSADVPGAVGVSFGALEVSGTLTLTRTVQVVNKGAADASFALSYDARTSIPGVSYSFPDGAALTVPAGGATTFRVQLSADASLMKNTRDATVDATQGSYPRHWLSEASGLIKLTPAAGPALRVPVYASARPASAMSVALSAISVAGPSFNADLPLVGRGVSTGALGASEHNSLVTALELQGLSPKLAAPPAGLAPSSLDADLQYVGVTANSNTIYFGLSTWRDFATLANDVQFVVYIDRNSDGVDDLALYNTRINAPSDVFVSTLLSLTTGASSAQGFANIFNSSIPTAALNNSVVVLPVSIGALGMPAGRTRLSYRVETSSSFNGLVDSAGPFSFDYTKRGFDFTGGSATATSVFIDQPGNTPSPLYSQANYLANNSRGLLLLHHYNVAGARAQVLPLVAQISISAPASAVLGQPPFAVSASASTGQSVTFSSLTPAVCTVSGASVTALAAGGCTVRAATAATANFGAASADATIQILPQPAATFDSGYTALCQAEPGALTVTGRVTLPPGAQAKVQTVWYITNPSDQSTAPVYQISGVLQDGDTFSVQVDWPGIRPDDTVVATYVGATLLDPVTLNPIAYSRGASKSFYWYPWVCPAPQP